MTFLSDERRALQDATRTFVEREVAPYLQEWEDAGEVPRGLHHAAAKAGLLGEGVAASTRFDPQAKAVGEWLRSRHVHIPEELL